MRKPQPLNGKGLLLPFIADPPEFCPLDFIGFTRWATPVAH